MVVSSATKVWKGGREERKHSFSLWVHSYLQGEMNVCLTDDECLCAGMDGEWWASRKGGGGVEGELLQPHSHEPATEDG